MRFQLKKSLPFKNWEPRPDGSGSFSLAESLSSDSGKVYLSAPAYRWPLWLHRALSSDHEESIDPIRTSCENTCLRDAHIVTNYLSKQWVAVDPAGMIHPSWASWSLEVWYIDGGEILRMHDGALPLIDTTDGCTVQWKSPAGQCTLTLAGARGNSDEMALSVSMKTTRSASGEGYLGLVVRPYTTETLGGISSIGCDETGLVTIDGTPAFILDSTANLVNTATDGSDISFSTDDDVRSCASPQGLASMLFAFPVQGKKAEILCRLSLDPGIAPAPSGISFAAIDKDFRALAAHRYAQGFQIGMADSKWLRYLKEARNFLLHAYAVRSIIIEEDPALQDILYLQQALLQHGYHDEAVDLVVSMKEQLRYQKKDIPQSYALAAASWLSALASLFQYTRDTDMIRQALSGVEEAVSMIQRWLKEKGGAIPAPFDGILDGPVVTMSIIGRAMNDAAELARNLGIFNLEASWKETAAGLVEKARSLRASVLHDRRKGRDVHLSYPGGLVGYEEFAEGEKNDFIFPGIGYDVQSRMLDLLARLRYGGNLKDEIHPFLDSLPHRGSLSELYHSRTGRAVYGRIPSWKTGALSALLVKDGVAFDTDTELVLFPAATEEWFNTEEMELVDVPSRFGTFSLKVVSLQKEIRFFFEDVPRIVPQEIHIHLPFRYTVTESDDFIIRQLDPGLLKIHGWPELLKIKRAAR